MKKFSIPFIVIALSLSMIITSCKKENLQPSNTITDQTTAPSHGRHKDDNAGDHDPNHHNGCNTTPPSATPEPACGTPTVVNLVSCQNNVVGTVTVSNGPTTLSVTYTATGSNHIKGLHLFVGAISQVPCSGSCTNTGGFPYVVSQYGSVSQYTINIPLSSLPACFSIAAEADIRSCDERSLHAWAAGTMIPACSNTGDGSGEDDHSGDGHRSGSGGDDHSGDGHRSCSGGDDHSGDGHRSGSGEDDHSGDDEGGSSCGSSRGTYFNYCKQSCIYTCIQPLSVLFSTENPWPNGGSSVVVGGYTYTVSNANDVLSEPTNDGQIAVLTVATLKIYGSTINPTPSVISSSNTVEAWLSTLGQLISTSQFTAPPNVKTAITNLQTWESSNYCH